MNTITENQVKNLANLFDERVKTETTFKDCRIVVEESCGEFDFEILVQDSFKGEWHCWLSDQGYSSEVIAIAQAKKWIDNYDGPGDEYYAQ